MNRSIFRLKITETIAEQTEVNLNMIEAVYDEDLQEIISPFYNHVDPRGITEGYSYFIASQYVEREWTFFDELFDKAIFHIIHPDKPISKWWRDIKADGLLYEKSNYYIAIDQQRKHAIFSIDDAERPVSDLWDYINPDWGVVLDWTMKYYIAVDKGNKRTGIFSLHNKHPLQWYTKVRPLVPYTSYPYLVIFDKYACQLINIHNPDVSLTYDRHIDIYTHDYIAFDYQPVFFTTNKDRTYSIYMFVNDVPKPLVVHRPVEERWYIYFTEDYVLYMTRDQRHWDWWDKMYMIDVRTQKEELIYTFERPVLFSNTIYCYAYAENRDTYHRLLHKQMIPLELDTHSCVLFDIQQRVCIEYPEKYIIDEVPF